MRIMRFAVLGVMLSNGVGLVHAQNPDSLATDDLFELPIEALMNVEVRVASTEAESIIETPAIVSSLDPEQLRVVGLPTLKDWISFSPGFVFQKSPVGSSPQMIRGVTEAFNQKVLFLLDGVPYWQPTHSDIPLAGIPDEAIDHVELIRGPGAVIHGTNATGGVINVVTKAQIDEPSPAILKLDVGTFNLVRATGYGAWSPGKTKLHLGFEYQTEKTYRVDGKAERAPGEEVVVGPIRQRDAAKSVWGRLRHGALSMTLHHYQNDFKGLAGVVSLQNHADVHFNGTLLALDWTKRLKRGYLKPYADLNRHYLRFELEKVVGDLDGGFRFVRDGKRNIRARSGLQFQYDVLDHFTFLSGYEFEFRASEQYEVFEATTDSTLFPLLQETDLFEHSFYMQGDYEVGAWRFLVGARYIYNEFAGSEVAPRVSVVYQINDFHSLKGLIAKGFNSPNFVQQAIRIPGVILGDMNNKAETVTSLDFAYSYFKANRLFVVNWFHYWADDFIQRLLTGNGVEAQFANADDFKRWGVEIDFQQRVQKAEVLANLSYHHGGNEHEGADRTRFFVPRWTANLGGAFQLFEGHKAGASWRFVDGRAAASSFHLLNASYRVAVKPFDISLTVENLLGQSIHSPDVNNFTIDRYYPAFADRPRLRLSIRFTSS